MAKRVGNKRQQTAPAPVTEANDLERAASLPATETIEQQNPQASGENPGKSPTDDDIRQRAYERFEARRGEGGDAMTDWLEAERELRQL